MNVLKRIAAAALALVFSAGVAPINKAIAEAGDSTDIVIDGSKANTAENMLFRGNGMVSANNSSRLLLDYKEKNPDAYDEILHLLFGEDGLNINHLKIEMGADINSSSGTEPSVKRTEDEKADVTRGAGFALAADAKKINPDLTLDMLWWSEPKWIDNSDDKYAARYKWYKETLDAAYEVYGLEFDYVSSTQNERKYDADWIKYLSRHLKDEDTAPYDYSKIKIVAGDEVCTWGIADEMLKDKELLDAIDAVGSHYTSWATDNAKKLASDYGKELWLSEGSSPMEYAKGTYRYDSSGTGLSEINGMLDIANRFITMYSGGLMTLYEYQPAVASYYDGATYTQKQLILANEPWSGYYELDGGFYMGLHFSQFIKKGWAFIDGACYGDGKAGGDGHAIVDAHYSYMTAADMQTGDYSTVITNTTDTPITYNFTVKELDKAGGDVYVWETKGAGSGDYDENYFKKREVITPEKTGEVYTYSVTVEPYSLVTVSTLENEEKDYTVNRQSTLLSLPYYDKLEGADRLSSRGGAPLYTTDEGGAFEIVTLDDGTDALMQMITKDIKAREWGGTPKPVTNFGDDRWFDYSVSAEVMLEKTDESDKNYAGIGLRYNLADMGQSGYWLCLFENGKWALMKNKNALQTGECDIKEGFNLLKLEAQNSTVKAYINDSLVTEYTEQGDSPVLSAGRAAFYSEYHNNCFRNLSIEPTGEDYAIERYDETEPLLSYTGQWEHNCMSSFRNYKRTISTASAGAQAELDFEGTGFALCGESGEGVIALSIDGGEEIEVPTPKTGPREVSYLLDGLEKGEHKAIIKVISGEFALDSVMIKGAPEKVLPQQEDTAAYTDGGKAEKGGSRKALAIGAAVAGAGAAAFLYARSRKKRKAQ